MSTPILNIVIGVLFLGHVHFDYGHIAKVMIVITAGKRVKELRERLNLSQGLLGERAGVDPSYISLLENGKRDNPGVESLQRLARALGTSVAYLIGETDDPSPPANNTKAPSPILARIKELAQSAGIAFDNLLTTAEVTESDLVGLDPDTPDPSVLWPVAQILGTSMSYLLGLTDRSKPILGVGQALHDSRNLYRPDAELTPEDAWDLEQAYLEVRRRREERKEKR